MKSEPNPTSLRTDALPEQPLIGSADLEAPPSRFRSPWPRMHEDVGRLRWLRPRLVDLALLGPLLSFVGVVHAWGMTRTPAPFDDEGTYVAQAWAVTKLQSLAHYTYWYDHPPLGWLLMALWNVIARGFGLEGSDLTVARELILAIQLVNCVLIYLLAKRLGIRRMFAAAAVLVFSLSPLALHFHRMALLDNIAVMWVLAAFFLALTPRSALWAYGGSGLCFAAAVLTKETTLLILPALALAVWSGSDRRTRSFSTVVFASLLCLLVLAYPLLAVLKGELLPGNGHVSLFGGIEFQLTRPSSGSLFDADSGARSLVDFWHSLDPFVLVMILVGIPYALAVRRLRPIGLALAIPVVVALRPGGYLPAMYVIALFPFAALAVAGMADSLARVAVPLEFSRFEGNVRARFASMNGRSIIGLAVVMAAFSLAAVVAGPRWATGTYAQMTDDDSVAFRQAKQWLFAHADRDSTILVDDTFWLDLVEGGFQSERVVWFYKFDLDPAVRARFPNGWRDFDYVVGTNMIAANTENLPATRAAYEHSHVVARFASGPEQVEIRRIGPSG